MASSTKEWKTTKDGQRYWRIYVSRGRGKSPYSELFYWPLKANGSFVSEKVALNALEKEKAAFTLKCNNGEVLTREEKKAIADKEKAEAAKIKTFRQYGDLVFLSDFENFVSDDKRSARTYQYYQNALKNHLYPEFGDMLITEISSAQLTHFFSELQKTQLSHSTIKGIYVTANMIFKKAYKEDVIFRNPLDKVDKPTPRKEEIKGKEPPPRFNNEELKYINKCLEEEPFKWQVFIQLLLNTGMRRGEACALTWDKIDFEKQIIKVDENIIYIPGSGTKINPPKTSAGNREIPISNKLIVLLKQYRADQIEKAEKRRKRKIKEHKPIDLEKDANPQYLFLAKGDNSNPLPPDAVNRYFNRFAKENNIEDFHPHKFRHTAISIMLERGIAPITVSAIAGHNSVSTTLNIYAHGDNEEMRNAINTLADAIDF